MNDDCTQDEDCAEFSKSGLCSRCAGDLSDLVRAFSHPQISTVVDSVDPSSGHQENVHFLRGFRRPTLDIV